MTTTQTPKALTEKQRLALRLMEARGTGALFTRLGWTWPQQVRESEEAAAAVVVALTCAEVR